jgi:hypothetical protein
MRSGSAPDSGGFGDHPDQHTGDPVRRLRVPGAGAAPGLDRAASPIGEARGSGPDHMRSQERLAARRHAGQNGPAFACALIADVAAAIGCTARLRPRTSITRQAGGSNRNDSAAAACPLISP